MLTQNQTIPTTTVALNVDRPFPFPIPSVSTSPVHPITPSSKLSLSSTAGIEDKYSSDFRAEDFQPHDWE